MSRAKFYKKPASGVSLNIKNVAHIVVYLVFVNCHLDVCYLYLVFVCVIVF